MKAIVHVGDMKAGSKSIQTFVKANQHLLEDCGVFVSRATRRRAYHSMLASYALDDTRLADNPRREWGITDRAQLADHRAEVERRIAGELTKAEPGINTFLFSHEGLLSLDTQEVNRLTAMLRQYFSDFRIVAYLRRQDRRLVSFWGQHVAAGRTPPKRLYKRFRDNKTYLAMLDNWERAVGRGSLSVRVFESKAFVGGCLHRDFCAAAEIPWNSKFVQPQYANIGLNRIAQAFLQSWSGNMQALSGSAERPPRAVVRFLKRYFTGQGTKPCRDWAKKVMKFFASENEEIRRRYFPDRPVLFDNDFRFFPRSGSPECTVQEAFRVATTMWQHFQQGTSEVQIQQAYQLVLGRRATPEEIGKHSCHGNSIQDLYVGLLKSEEYHACRRSGAVQPNKEAA